MLISLVILVIANILFSLVPLFLIDSLSYSIFSVTFVRFLFASVIEFGILIISIVIRQTKVNTEYKRRLDNSNNSSMTPQNGKQNLFRYYFRDYLLGKNEKLGKGVSQLGFYSLLGVMLVTFSIPLYFFAITKFGVVITTIVINTGSLLIISLYNILNKEEQFDTLKFVYMTLLITSVFTATFGRNVETTITLNYEGTLTLVISVFTWILFMILTGKSTYKPKIKIDSELKRVADISNLSKLIRSLIQLFFTHILGTLFLFPLCILIILFGAESQIRIESLQFFTEITLNLSNLLVTPGMVFMVLFGTVIPYLLMFMSAAIWPKGSLKHDQWNSILALLEPLIGLYIGYLFWNELIHLDYMIFTTILLLSSIIIRYFYESKNTFDFFFFLKIQKNILSVIQFLQKNHDIESIAVTCGDWDVIFKIKMRNMEKFYIFTKKLELNAEISHFIYMIADKTYTGKKQHVKIMD
jgi:hypothetical protein